MKYINILVAIISAGIVVTYLITGFDFMSKERLIQMAYSLTFVVFLYSIRGIYFSFKKAN